MPLFRRNAAIERIEIDLAHRRRSPALDHLKPLVELRREAGPRRAEPRLDAARAPFFGPLADLVGREEPYQLRARQIRLIRRRAPVCQPDSSGIGHLVAEMGVQPRAQIAVARHVDEGDRVVGRK